MSPTLLDLNNELNKKIGLIIDFFLVDKIIIRE